MSSSQKNLDGKRSGKVPEKSNFASTCNLLSQYLKETGNLKELSRSISGNLESPGKSDASEITKSGLSSKKLLNNLADLNQPPFEETTPVEDFLPFGQTVSPNYSEDCPNKATASKQTTKMECKSDQMTILYDGKIFVFDDFPANKAYELMILASKGNTAATNANLSTTGKKNAEEQQPDDIINNSDEMPIARRSSLHRFIEKRKERSSTRGPYQVGGESPEPSSIEDKELELRL